MVPGGLLATERLAAGGPTGRFVAVVASLWVTFAELRWSELCCSRLHVLVQLVAWRQESTCLCRNLLRGYNLPASPAPNSLSSRAELVLVQGLFFSCTSRRTVPSFPFHFSLLDLHQLAD